MLWVFIALYVLMSAARLLHNTYLQRLTPFISVALLMGFATIHGIRRYHGHSARCDCVSAR